MSDYSASQATKLSGLPTHTFSDVAEGSNLSVFFNFEHGHGIPKDGALNATVEMLVSGEATQHAADVRVVKMHEFRQGSDTAEQSIGGVAVSFTCPRFEGKVQVKLEWTDQGTQTLVHEVPVGTPLNRESDVALPFRIPRLSDLIAKPRVASSSTSGSSPDVGADTKLFEMLTHIHRQLRAGLGGFWRSQGAQCCAPSGLKALSECTDEEIDSLEDELEIMDNDAASAARKRKEIGLAMLNEAWAQRLTEVLVGTVYQGPGAFHGAKPLSETEAVGGKEHRIDARFYDLVKQAAEAKGEFVVSLVHACQQLCTTAVMSRGHLEAARNPVAANRPKTYGEVSGKKAWTETNTSKQMRQPSGAKLMKEGYFFPGTLLYQDPENRPDKSKTAIPHVAFVLRAQVTSVGENAEGQIQMIDTGGWNFGTCPIPSPPGDPNGGHRSACNHDTVGKASWNEPVAEVMVLPQEPARLRTAVKLLRNARPLGVMRLVILKRGAGHARLATSNVVWISQRVNMYEGDGADYRAYGVLKLLHSLRDCPHMGEFEARWQVWAPGDDATLHGAIVEVRRGQKWWTVPGKNRCKAVVEIGVSTDGTPVILQRTHQFVRSDVNLGLPNLDVLEGATAPAALPPNWVVPPDGIPAFFKG